MRQTVQPGLEWRKTDATLNVSGVLRLRILRSSQHNEISGINQSTGGFVRAHTERKPQRCLYVLRGNRLETGCLLQNHLFCKPHAPWACSRYADAMEMGSQKRSCPTPAALEFRLNITPTHTQNVLLPVIYSDEMEKGCEAYSNDVTPRSSTTPAI